MKKRLLVIVILMVMGFTFLAAEDGGDPCDMKSFTLAIGAGARTFSESLFKDIYGSSSMVYSFDFGVKVISNLQAFLHIDYLSVDGELTYTKEKTTLKIFPVELGVRYRFCISKSGKLKLFPYIGVGAGYYKIEEENAIGTFDENKMGFFGEGGFRFYVTGSIFIDAKLKFVALKLKNNINEDIKLGGLLYTGGIGIAF